MQAQNACCKLKLVFLETETLLHTFPCFSFWVESILKWTGSRVYIKLTVSGLRAFHSLVNEPQKYGEAIAIVYEHIKRTQELLFADLWAQYFVDFLYFLSRA